MASVIAGLLGIAGLGAIGHALYRSDHSGVEIYAARLQVRDGPIKSFDIELDPSMAPLQFDFWARLDSSYVERWVKRQEFAYRMTLSQDRKPVLQQNVYFSIDAEAERKNENPLLPSSTQSAAGIASVPGAGRFQFAMAPQGSSDVRAIKNMEVKVRRNVEGVEMKKICWGIGLSLAGGIIQLLFGAALPGKRND